MPLYLKYNGKYYPQLGYLVGQRTGKIQKLYPDSDASVILNWYGGAGTFENLPMYKLIKAAEGKEKFDYNFHNKN